MAQFRGILQNNKGQTSRLGHKSSGLFAQLNGWNIGVNIELSHENGEDVIRVYENGGSNNGGNKKLIVVIKEGRE